MTTKRIMTWVALLAAGAWLLAAVGCEDADPIAQSDWILSVTANPATLAVGPGQQGQSVITAIVIDESGVPQAGVGIRFSTTAGTLASGGRVRTTNTRGEVQDTLTSDFDATVTASSGSLSATVDVLVDALLGPLAILDFDPPFQATVGATVTFLGDLSDGNISEYRWAIISDAPDPGSPNPDTQTTSQPSITRSYAQPQALDVTLEVLDTNGLTDRVTEFYDIVAAR